MRRGTIIRRAVLLAAALVLLLCCAYITAESGHKCTGEHCPVCAHIHVYMDMLMSLVFLAAAGEFTAAVIRIGYYRVAAPACTRATSATPVMLKVRQNS